MNFAECTTVSLANWNIYKSATKQTKGGSMFILSVLSLLAGLLLGISAIQCRKDEGNIVASVLVCEAVFYCIVSWFIMKLI